MSVVFRDVAGVEHSIDVRSSSRNRHGSYPFPYSENASTVKYDLRGAAAIRYEIRFGHYTS